MDEPGVDPTDAPRNTEPLPERVGPYRVLGRLGRGGMGEVLEGWDDRLDRPIALKRVLRDARDPQRARQRFRREARAVARLSDSAIVQVYDWVEVGDDDWLVMEKVEGRALDTVLAEGRLPYDLALRVAREVASGLAAAHDAGLVHRDLKASNVMLLRAGTPGTTRNPIKILDFGIAKPIAPGDGADETTLTAEGQLVGTPGAMSPEQALGQPVDHRSDLFSLGSLLYELLSHQQPFVGRNPVETISRICTWKQTALHRLDPTIPLRVSRLGDHLLAKEPARRPATARQVAETLASLLEAETQEPPDSATLDQTTRIELLAPDKAESGEASDPAPPVGAPPQATHRRVWGLALALGILVTTLGLIRLDAPPSQNENSQVATAPALDRHQLFLRGMEKLDRYDLEGHIDDAITSFQRALELDEDNAPALAGLARAYWLDSVNDNKDPARKQQALAAARRAVAIDPFLALARISLATSLKAVGDGERAQQELERALELEPGNALALSELGKVLRRQEPSLAETYALRAIERAPEMWSYHCDLGVFYYGAGRLAEAEKAFVRSLTLAPGNYLIHRNLGAVYSMQGHLEQAAEQLQLALQARADASVYTNLGTIYFTQGLYPQSASAFRQAIESGGANFYYNWANLGDAYRWIPDREAQAREAYQRALQLLQPELVESPANPTLRTREMLYRAKMGDCDWSPAADREVAELSQGHASAWFRLTGAHELCNRRDAALAALGEALRGGYPPNAISTDPELRALRRDPQYHRLVMGFE